MKLIKSKKALVLLAVTVVAVVAAVAGYAYWTTTGSGSGQAANASSNGTVTLHASWTAGQLYPGGSVPVAFTADNAGASNLYVGTIHTSSIQTSDSNCLASDFSMADVAENTMVAAGASGASLPNGGTLVFANSAVSQDACKGATITVNLTSN